MNARPNWRILYFGSAALEDSEVLHGLRRRALSGDPGSRFAYLEYSPEFEHPERRFDPLDESTWAPGFDPGDPEVWAAANPAMNLRVMEDTLQTRYLNAAARGPLPNCHHVCYNHQCCIDLLPDRLAGCAKFFHHGAPASRIQLILFRYTWREYGGGFVTESPSR